LIARNGSQAMTALVDQADDFDRFAVHRELEVADLRSGAGRTALIERVKPILMDATIGTDKDRLVPIVADRLGLKETMLWDLLRDERSHAPAPRDASGERPAVKRALSAPARQERAFLVQCLVMPDAGRAALQNADLDELFTDDLARRAAYHLREHADDPTAGLAVVGEDGEADSEADALARYVAELSVRASRNAPSAAALEGELLGLELQRVERAIASARASASGDVAPLVELRQGLRERRDRAIERAMAETQPVR